MRCEDIRILLAGYQDGELDREEKEMVEKHLAECPDCRAELARLDRVKEAAQRVKFDDLPLEVWEGYWQNIYRRIERGLGWIFLSVGAIILVGTGIFYLVREFFMSPSIGILLKIGVGATIAGGLFLSISALRERIFACQRERYKEVQR